jgi:hypothetical protein
MLAFSPLVCHVRRPLNKAPKQELQYAVQVPNKKRVDQKMTSSGSGLHRRMLFLAAAGIPVNAFSSLAMELQSHVEGFLHE